LLKAKEGRLKRERKAVLLLAKQSLSRARRLEKQMKFLKSKGKDMVCCSLTTMDKLDKVEEKEKQMESEQAATAAILSNVPILSATEADPFAGLEVLLLPLKV
jgi:Lon protease-like protein